MKNTVRDITWGAARVGTKLAITAALVVLAALGARAITLDDVAYDTLMWSASDPFGFNRITYAYQYGESDIAASPTNWFQYAPDGGVRVLWENVNDTVMVLPYEMNGYAITRVVGDVQTNGMVIVQKLYVPRNITAISNEAFRDQLALQYIYGGAGVTRVTTGAFRNTGLVEFPHFPRLQIAGENAFRHNKNFNTVRLPDSTYLVGEDAFRDCEMRTVIAGMLDELEKGAFKENKYLKNWEVRGVRKVGTEAFQDCIALVDITLCGTERIKQKAFRRCSVLETVYLDSELLEINEDVFVDTPEGVKVIVTDPTVPDFGSTIDGGADKIVPVIRPELHTGALTLNGVTYTEIPPPVDIAGLVPYTGATANLTLGTRRITAGNFRTWGTGNFYIGATLGATPVGAVNTTVINSTLVAASAPRRSVFIGAGAGTYIKGPTDNNYYGHVAIGVDALTGTAVSGATGATCGHTAIGWSALRGGGGVTTSGSTAVGAYALGNIALNHRGDGTIGVGHAAGCCYEGNTALTLTHSPGSIYIGARSGPTANGAVNCIAIGTDAMTPAGDNRIMLGNSNHTHTHLNGTIYFGATTARSVGVSGGDVVVTTSTGKLRASGGYKSADGSAGAASTLVFHTTDMQTHILTFKDGLLTDHNVVATVGADLWQDVSGTDEEVVVGVTKSQVRVSGTGDIVVTFDGLLDGSAIYFVAQGMATLAVTDAYWVGGGSYVAGRANHYVVTKYGDEVLINSITTTEIK